MSAAPEHQLEPNILTRPEHRLSRRNISTEALKVLYRLHRAGYLSYLVGGAVRDLLLGLRPKDFDVATNARPQAIRRLFRNSRIIGRRFRLVHVVFKGEVVEVATFRATPEPPEVPESWEEGSEPEEDGSEEVVEERNGERVYGTPAEDAQRRDFTVNALFYNIADFTVIDHVGGIEDLDRRVIRTIGDAEARFEEDPVRMMRAHEYAVRTGFALATETAEAIPRCAPLIAEVAPARLAYELLESLRSGSAAGIVRSWRRAGLFDRAFPNVTVDGERLGGVLEGIDDILKSGAQISDAALIGALFLPRAVPLVEELTVPDRRLDRAALLLGLRDVLEPAWTTMHLPNHTLHLMHQALFALSKLRKIPERGHQVAKLARQDYFPTAWTLYSVACSAGLLPVEPHRMWSRAVDLARRGDRDLDEVLGVERTRKRRRRRPRRRRKQ